MDYVTKPGIGGNHAIYAELISILANQVARYICLTKKAANGIYRFCLEKMAPKFKFCFQEVRRIDDFY